MLGISRIRTDWPTFWGALGFVLVGGGFAVFGGAQLWSAYAFTRGAIPVAATVIDNPADCNDDGDCTFRPLLRFDDPDGAVREARTHFGASHYGWTEGTQVEALFNPEHPDLRMAGRDNLYLLGGWFLGLGSVAAALGVWLLARMTFTRRA